MLRRRLLFAHALIPTLVSPKRNTLTYNTSEQELITSGSVKHGTLYYKLNNGEYSSTIPKGTNAGTYNVYFKVIGDEHYEDIEEQLLICTIDKAQLSYTEPTPLSSTYDATEHNLITPGTGGLPGTFYYQKNTDGWITTIPKGTNAGYYTISWKIDVNSNYYNVTPQSFEVLIDKANPILGDITVKTLTYNGNAQNLIDAVTTTGGTVVYCIGDQNGTYNPDIPTGTNAGNYIVYVKAVGNTNYNNSEIKSANCKINKANITVTAPTPKPGLIYDGQSKKLCNPGTTNYGTMLYKLGDTGTYSTAIPEATEIAVYTIYYKVNGNSNYNDYTERSITAQISDKIVPDVTVPTAASTMTYNGSARNLLSKGGTTTGGTMQYSLDYSNWSTSIPQATNAGTYNVYYRSLGDDTYATVEGTDMYVPTTINQAAALKSAPSGQTLTYNGSAQYLCTTGSTNNGTMEYKLGSSGSWSTSRPTATNASTYTVYYRVVPTSDNYYGNDGNISSTINKRSALKSAPTSKSLTYDGSSKQLCGAGSTYSGTMEYSLNNSTWSTSIPTGSSVQTYTIYYRITQGVDSNHSTVSGSSYKITSYIYNPGTTIYVYHNGYGLSDVTVKQGSTTQTTNSGGYTTFTGLNSNQSYYYSLSYNGYSWGDYVTGNEDKTYEFDDDYDIYGTTSKTVSADTTSVTFSYGLDYGCSLGWTAQSDTNAVSVYNSNNVTNYSLNQSGKSVTITFSENTSYSNTSSHSITLTYHGDTITFTATQSAKEHIYSLEVSPSSASYLSYNGDSDSLSYVYLYIDGTKQNTNIKNNCTLSTSQSWITISGTSWTISSYSTYDSTRTGTITVSYTYNGKTLTYDIDISQDGPEHTYSLEVSPGSDSYLYNGGARGLSSVYLYIDGVKQNTDIKNSCTLSTSQSWITINGRNWIIGSYSTYESTRTGTITVSYIYGGKTVYGYIDISQSGPSHTYSISWNNSSSSLLNFSTPSSSSGSDNDSFGYSITVDGSTASDVTEVTASISGSWCTMSHYQYSKKCGISWTENTGSTRSTTLTLTYHGKTITAAIIQTGISYGITVIPNSYSYNNGNHSDNLGSVYLTENGYQTGSNIKSSCTLSTSQSWITIGTNSWFIDSYNTYDSTRTGTITVSYTYKGETLTDNISISQSGPEHTYSISWVNSSDESYYIDSTEAGSKTSSEFKYAIYKDGSAASDTSAVSASSSESWLTVNIYKSMQDIDISWTKNTGFTRYATITVSYHNKTITSTVQQLGVHQPVSTITANVYIYKNGQRSTDADIEMTRSGENALEAIDGGSLTLNQNESYTYQVNPVVGVSFSSIVIDNTSSGMYTSANSTGTITTGSSNMNIHVYLTT